MHRREHTVDMVEQAIRSNPYCPNCGEHTEIVRVGNELILRCSAIGHPRTRLERWFGSLIGPEHVSYPILELSMARAA